MNTQAHTPGPWKVIDTNPSVIFVSSETHGGICQIPSDKHSEEHRANAQLIASAPEIAKERDELKAILQESEKNYVGKNARLEALNAELLEALKEAEIYFRKLTKGGKKAKRVYPLIQSAIAKAEGKD